MTVYYANAAGSDTAPYDTPAKGANLIGTIKAIPWLSGDIVEVVDDGDIIEEVSIPNATDNITIRSYGTDGNDRETSKPTVRKNTATTPFITAVGTDWNIQNIEFLKNNGSDDNYIAVAPSKSDVTIEGNKFKMVGAGSGASPDKTYAVFFNEDQTNPICRNNIYDGTEAGVQFIATPGPPP